MMPIGFSRMSRFLSVDMYEAKCPKLNDCDSLSEPQFCYAYIQDSVDFACVDKARMC